jgi:hypothetical protein
MSSCASNFFSFFQTILKVFEDLPQMKSILWIANSFQFCLFFWIHSFEPILHPWTKTRDLKHVGWSTRFQQNAPDLSGEALYSARKMKLVTSLKFYFLPASPTTKLLHNQQTKRSSRFQNINRFLIFSASTDPTNVSFIGMSFFVL